MIYDKSKKNLIYFAVLFSTTKKRVPLIYGKLKETTHA